MCDVLQIISYLSQLFQAFELDRPHWTRWYHLPLKTLSFYVISQVNFLGNWIQTLCLY